MVGIMLQSLVGIRVAGKGDPGEGNAETPPDPAANGLIQVEIIRRRVVGVGSCLSDGYFVESLFVLGPVRQLAYEVFGVSAME
jgi:hypothetical protein